MEYKSRFRMVRIGFFSIKDLNMKKKGQVNSSDPVHKEVKLILKTGNVNCIKFFDITNVEIVDK